MPKIIKIDESKCNGCGLCAEACHEGAIAMVNGVAKLVSEEYCDGLGDCLPVCPTNAITLIEREITNDVKKPLPCGCPSEHAKTFERTNFQPETPAFTQSMLKQWPVQIKLLPVKASFYDNANLLIAADCSAFAYANFHARFINNHITAIGCPKLDMVDYKDKLTMILSNNDIKSLTIVRMSVPCCGGIEMAAKEALKASGKFIPWSVVTISTSGEIID